MTEWNKALAKFLESRFTDNTLRIAIIVVSVIAIGLALSLKSTWELALVLAYLIFP